MDAAFTNWEMKPSDPMHRRLESNGIRIRPWYATLLPHCVGQEPW